MQLHCGQYLVAAINNKHTKMIPGYFSKCWGRQTKNILEIAQQVFCTLLSKYITHGHCFSSDASDGTCVCIQQFGCCDLGLLVFSAYYTKMCIFCTLLPSEKIPDHFKNK